jgi:hypothetical protein
VPRSHCRETINDTLTGVPIANAVVTIREQGSGSAIAATMYDAKSGGAPVPNPITTDATGTVEFWLDAAQQVDFRVVAAGYLDVTISDIPVLVDQTEIVTKTRTETLTNKTLTSPTITSPSISGATLTGQTTLPDGTLTSTSWGFSSDATKRNGPYRVGADEWSEVAGGLPAVRYRMGPKGSPQIGFGTIWDVGSAPYWVWTSPDSIMKLHHVQQGATSGHLVGFHLEVQNDANSVGGSGVADSSTLTAVYYERLATAGGSFRVGEFQGFRDTAGADGIANATANVLELAMHNAGVRSLGAGGVYKIGIINSLATSANLNETPLPMDYHIFMHGDLGQEDWVTVLDESSTALGLVWRLKHNGSMQALGTTTDPIYTYIGDTDTGIGRPAANTLNGKAGNVEGWRVGSDGRMTLQKAVIQAGFITPTTLAANVNNYRPTNFATASAVRLVASTPVDITGIDSATDSIPTGFTQSWCNVGGNAITLKNNSASSSAGNKFALGADLVLGQDQSVLLWFDQNVWRRRA